MASDMVCSHQRIQLRRGRLAILRLKAITPVNEGDMFLGHDVAFELTETAVRILYADNARGLKRAFGEELTIPYSAIEEVLAQPPNGGASGWIKLVVVGTQDSSDLRPARDPFAIVVANNKQWKAIAPALKVIAEAAFAAPKTVQPRLVEIASASRTRVEAHFLDIDVTATDIYADGDAASVRGIVARVESSGQINSRVTVTRAALLGAFAAVVPKRRDDRVLYLTIEGPSLSVVKELDPTREHDARTFAARVNQLAAAQTDGPSAGSESATLFDQIRQLGELHAAGFISDAEFEAKKAEMLSRM